MCGTVVISGTRLDVLTTLTDNTIQEESSKYLDLSPKSTKKAAIGKELLVVRVKLFRR